MTSDQGADEPVRTVQAVPDVVIAPGAPVAEPAGVGPATMSRWLWFAYPLAVVGPSVMLGAIGAILLGRQVAVFVPGAQASAGALGLVISGASIVAVVAQPIMGRISDRARVPVLGRRNFWILIGALATAAVLVVTATSANLAVLAVSYAVALIPFSLLQSALTAVLPERVPLRLRGRMSGLYGFGQTAGGFIGATTGGLVGQVVIGYEVAIVFLVLTSALFALTTRDVARPVLRSAGPDAARQKQPLPGFRAYPDFWWTFLGRFGLLLGYFFFATFTLYAIRDYIRVGGGDVTKAAAATVLPSIIAASMTVVFGLIGGVLVDRIGRVRIFVVIGAVLVIPGAIILIAAPSYPAFMLASAFIGAGFGSYIAVDQVLISRVLPPTGNAARDLGLMNIANSGPQVLAPVIAGAIVAVTGSYQLLYAAMIVAVLVAVVSVRFIRSVP